MENYVYILGSSILVNKEIKVTPIIQTLEKKSSFLEWPPATNYNILIFLNHENYQCRSTFSA